MHRSWQRWLGRRKNRHKFTWEKFNILLARYSLQNPRRPITLVLAEERTEESIREAFFAKRTIGWGADMIFGRPEWVQKLFVACTEIGAVAHSGGNVTMTAKNKSDIPMNVKVGSFNEELKPQKEVAIS